MMLKRTGTVLFLSVLTLLSGLGVIHRCASEAPPPGGPKDVDPPAVVQVYPEPGAVNIPTDVEIQFEFDEYVNRRSVEPAIFISPYLEGGYEVEPSRRSVSVNFTNPLEDSTTYIVTLGTGIADLRGNKLASSYQLAFSTGDSIDQGEISGQVYPGELQQKKDISVLAYLRDGSVPDSLLIRRPDYISNPDAEGRFTFSNMQTGRYFFLALIDQNGNYIYDPGEWTGLPFKSDWNVTRKNETGLLKMRMFQYPADSLVLMKVEQEHRHRLRAGLNRPPVQEVSDRNFRFVTEAGDTLHPVAVTETGNPAEFTIEHYQTVPDSQYLFMVGELTDRFGLPFGRNRDRRDVTITTEPDTFSFRYPEISIPDSMPEVKQSQELRISFSRAVRTIPADSVLRLDSLAADTASVFWRDPATLVASPDSLWPANQRISWVLIDSLIRDHRDSTYSDSLSSLAFQAESGARYGSITGTVSAPEHWTRELIRIRAETGQRGDTRIPETTLSSDGEYQLERLIPGQYQLEAYYDRDTSGTYSYGRPVPFVPSENFLIFQDSIEVRSRWEQSGINLQFPDTDE